MILSVLFTLAVAAPSLDAPVRSGMVSAGDAALVIGVEDYAFIPDVPFAARDASAARDLMVYTRGVPAKRVETLVNPSREQMLQGLERVAKLVADDGTLWVYYAGHGAASATDGSRMLLGVDVMADPGVFQARALGVDELIAAAGDSRAHNVVLIMDTCYAGVGRSGAELLPGTRFAVPAYATQSDAHVTVWSAASANQLSSSYPEARQGLFTTFAVGALRGWADGELSGLPDGMVTMDEAQAYVERTLGALSKHGQTPVLSAGDSAIVLTKGALEGPPSLEQETSAPAGDLSEQLAQIRESQQARLQSDAAVDRAYRLAVTDASQEVRIEARKNWKQVEVLVAAGGTEAELGLRNFIGAYEAATVTIDGQAVAIEILEVAAAREALRKLSTLGAPVDLNRRRSMTRSGLIVGGVAVVAFGTAAVTKAQYRNAPPTDGPLGGLFVANRTATYASVGLGAISASLFIGGQF